MPGIFFKPLDRRRFLTATASGVAAVAFSGCRGTQVRVQGPPEYKLHLALLSDTHTPGDRKEAYRGFTPWDNLQTVVNEVKEVRPEGVLINGDLARSEGLVADYVEVRSLLEPIAAFAPVYFGLGNHDDRANFTKTFSAPQRERASVTDKLVLAIDQGFMRIVLLDSLMYTNKTPGLLGKNQRAWLKEYLATNSDKPIVIFVHHTLGDNDGELLDARQLFDMVQPHPQVKAIFYGHSHAWELKRRERLHLVNLPAVGYSFSEKEPVGWVDARFDDKGVDLTLRVIAGAKTDDRKVHRLNWS